MRGYDAETLAALQAGDLIAKRLVWIEARRVADNVLEGLGLWSGDFDLALDIEGAPRSYVGVSALLLPEPITAGPGLDVRIHRERLAAIDPGVEDLVLGYRTRLAPVEVHRLFLDPASRQLIGAPHRVFRGVVMGVSFPTEPEADAACELELAGEAFQLTRALATRKSDAGHRRRDPADAFRAHADAAGDVFWGEVRGQT